MTNEQQEVKKTADKRANDFYRKLCAGGFRDQHKGIEGGHRNPRWKKPKKKAEKKILAEESALVGKQGE